MLVYCIHYTDKEKESQRRKIYLHFTDVETNKWFSKLPKATQLVSGTDFYIMEPNAKTSTLHLATSAAKGMAFGVLAPPFPSCVTLVRLLHL